MKNFGLPFIFLAGTVLISCKKEGCTDAAATNYNEKAKKDDGTCVYADPELTVPSTYNFTDAAGNNTVSYGGQTERINQLAEMVTYMKTGVTTELSETALNAMFSNADGNGGGYFTFTSTKQLKDKCFALDVPLIEGYLANLATASASFAETATNGQAGTLSSGTSIYLFDQNGVQPSELIEKTVMSAVFMHQTLSVYFGSEKMNVDNSVAVDGQYYTEMEHHWDEAFGYFGVPTDFPTNTTNLKFWAKYCNNQNANLGSNATLMNAFLKGRALIQQKKELTLRDAEILTIRKTWERVAASQAVTYLEAAKSHFGSDNAKFLHEVSEAYGFIQGLKYVPLETRVIAYTEIEGLLTETLGTNFWEITLVDLNSAINTLNSIYGF